MAFIRLVSRLAAGCHSYVLFFFETLHVAMPLFYTCSFSLFVITCSLTHSFLIEKIMYPSLLRFPVSVCTSIPYSIRRLTLDFVLPLPRLGFCLLSLPRPSYSLPLRPLLLPLPHPTPPHISLCLLTPNHPAPHLPLGLIDYLRCGSREGYIPRAYHVSTLTFTSAVSGIYSLE